MLDRRKSVRDKVLFGGVAAVNGSASTTGCVVRNISDDGACIEFESPAKLPDQIRLTIPRKGRSFQAQEIWRRENKVGYAFRSVTASGTPANDLDKRMRRSEQKQRELQRRIKDLMGEG
jgi:PilZ domain